MSIITRRAIGLSVGGALAAWAGSKARAHGGGLNAQGCHTNRKTGDYHCHRAPATLASPSPASSSGLYASSPAGNSPQRVMATQAALNALGYQVGAVDGRSGARTLDALREFERDQGMSPLGVIDDAALYQLVLALASKQGC